MPSYQFHIRKAHSDYPIRKYLSPVGAVQFAEITGINLLPPHGPHLSDVDRNFSVIGISEVLS